VHTKNGSDQAEEQPAPKSAAALLRQGREGPQQLDKRSARPERASHPGPQQEPIYQLSAPASHRG